MSEWIKMIVAAAATIVGVYVTLSADVKDHGRRIDRLEDWSDKHDERHQAQWDKIDGRLSRIEIALGIGRMGETETRVPRPMAPMMGSLPDARPQR
jgi:hypothetical protein